MTSVKGLVKIPADLITGGIKSLLPALLELKEANILQICSSFVMGMLTLVPL